MKKPTINKMQPKVINMGIKDGSELWSTARGGAAGGGLLVVAAVTVAHNCSSKRRMCEGVVVVFIWILCYGQLVSGWSNMCARLCIMYLQIYFNFNFYVCYIIYLDDCVLFFVNCEPCTTSKLFTHYSLHS